MPGRLAIKALALLVLLASASSAWAGHRGTSLFNRSRTLLRLVPKPAECTGRFLIRQISLPDWSSHEWPLDCGASLPSELILGLDGRIEVQALGDSSSLCFEVEAENPIWPKPQGVGTLEFRAKRCNGRLWVELLSNLTLPFQVNPAGSDPGQLVVRWYDPEEERYRQAMEQLDEQLDADAKAKARCVIL